MNRVIVLEGPDGGGKTTLAKLLIETFGAEYRHEGPPPTNVNLFKYYSDKLFETVVLSRPVVFDRLWLGETVYGPVTRNVSLLEYAEVRCLDGVMSSFQIAHVLCLPDLHTCLSNYKVKYLEEDDYLKSFDKWDAVYHRYVDTIPKFNLIEYDYTKLNSFQELYEKLLEVKPYEKTV